jgi:hypothetical protein
MQRVYDMFNNTKVKVVQISIDVGGANDVAPFFANSHYTLPSLIHSKGEVFARYGLRGTPGTFIIDPPGMIVARGFGAVKFDSPEFRTYIKRLAGIAI